MSFKLIKFHATWCGPCKLIAPYIEEAGTRYKLDIVSIDATGNEDALHKYKVKGFPTLILEENGKEIGRQLGSNPKGRLFNWIEGLGVPVK